MFLNCIVVIPVYSFCGGCCMFMSYFDLGCAWKTNQDYENSNAISSREDLSPSDVNDKRLQYFLWIKRAADGARSGGMGRSKQLRYHHCYFNPISCFRKRAIESSQLPESYTGTL
ncbi:hypothetical protein GHT06_016444 [Daphnia sinensis]|uniref:Uncharacterized protein n=1 Tax=Daphnia sinensis TaxID=1820382 RepID=A0AAD5KNK0_9CRUS|nr:hypothetical protein GHT06_016444 [Daphnia sinensis]